MGERIDLTIGSGCAACSLPVGVASTVDPQEYIAANAEKIWELGFNPPTLKFQTGDVQNLKFSVMDKLHKLESSGTYVVQCVRRVPEEQL